MNTKEVRHRHRWAEFVAGVLLLATAMSAAGPAASAARADDTPDQKRANDQNTMKDIGIGAGALGLWEMLHGRGTNALILGAGAAYAGKKYEDDRKAAAAEQQAKEEREERRLGEERRRARERDSYVPSGAAPVGTTSSAEMPAAAPIHVFVNDQPVHFSDAGPEMTAGSVYVPMRGVLEKIGANVRWDESDRSIVATRGDKVVTLPVNGQADVNGEKMSLDTPAYIANGRTMVPLRFLAQTFGAQVAWDPSDRDVHIATDNLSEAR